MKDNRDRLITAKKKAARQAAKQGPKPAPVSATDKDRNKKPAAGKQKKGNGICPVSE